MPINYAIMRCKKHKTMGTIASAMQHNFRERETINADSALTENNRHLAAKNTDEAMGALRENLPEKVRANGVRCVEYMMTASPEWWQSATPEDQQSFFDSSLEWLKDKYGKQNVIAASIHLDETSPHLSAFVTPITQDGRLCARDFIGGKDKLSADQSSYAEKIQAGGLSLERGIRGSKANHISIKQYYDTANQADRLISHINSFRENIDATPKTIKKGIFSDTVETPESVSERIGKELDPVFSLAKRGATEAALKPLNDRRAEHLKRTDDYIFGVRAKMKSVFDTLSLGQIEKIENTISEATEFNKQYKNKINNNELLNEKYPVSDPRKVGHVMNELGVDTPGGAWGHEKRESEKILRKQEKTQERIAAGKSEKRGGGFRIKLDRF